MQMKCYIRDQGQNDVIGKANNRHKISETAEFILTL